jgi:hypothetical protein
LNVCHSLNNITLNANNNINAAGVDIQADNSISGTAKDINLHFVVVLFGAVVVLFGVLRFVLAMVGVVARVVIKIPLYTSAEDLEGRIKKTAVNSTLSGNNITLNGCLGRLWFYLEY